MKKPRRTQTGQGGILQASVINRDLTGREAGKEWI